jgi:hypothetical protein
MAKKFPDLTGDGEVTYADVLEGRGAFAEGSLLSSLEMSLEEIDDEAIVKLTGKDPSPESRKEASEILKFMSEAGEAILELNSSKKPTTRKGIAEYNKKQKELTKKVDKLKKDLGSQFNFFKYQILRDAGRVEKNEGGEVDNYIELFEQMQMSLEKAKSEEEENIIRQRFEQSTKGFDQNIIMQAYKKMDAMREQMFEGGSLMVPPEREAYGKGGAILDLVAALTGKQTKAAKKKMVDEEKALQDISKMIEDNPRVLDELTNEQYETVVSKLPQRQAAKLGMGEEPLTDMVEMARGMEPAEVAKNLEMFNDIDEIFEYTDTLDAKGARQFMQNLSDEDLEIFGADLPDVGATLGPRELKAEGGEIPEDTYNNLSPEDKMEQAEDMLPDEEMEEEYVDFVASEILDQEEQDYLFKALDDDPRLEEILDKVILNATEFAGSGEVEGPGTGISDSIPARLSDGEFVFTKKATDQLGADNLQVMMDDAERAYDGGLMAMAEGGMPVDDRYSNQQQDEDQEEKVEDQMLYASRMPSLMNR